MKLSRAMKTGSSARIVRVGLLLAAIVPAHLATAQATSAQTPFDETTKGAIAQPSLKQAPVQTRSAQSDCVREANRRGYSVTDTSNFQQSRDGWSIDLRARDRRGRMVNGSCFVETRTGDVSLYGFGWGDDWNGQTSLEFVCASTDMRYRECQLPVNGRVRLVKKISDARCVEGQTWAQRGDRVWVDQGCRARFEVSRGGGGGSGGIIQCASENQRYRECPIGNGYSARLVRETSNGRCRKDSTWGTRNGVIWVTNGCRGEFERLRGVGHGNNPGLPGNVARVQDACLNEARQLGFNVTQQFAPQAVTGGYRMPLQVRKNNGNGKTRGAMCTYSTSTGLARIEM